MLLAFLAGAGTLTAVNRLRSSGVPAPDAVPATGSTTGSITADLPPAYSQPDPVVAKGSDDPHEAPTQHPGPAVLSTRRAERIADPERFDQLELLGAGAMGKVYGAILRATGDRVAIKVMAPGLRGNDDLCARFEREGEALARLFHPGIVKVYELTTEPSLALVMERVEGRELAELVRDEAPLPLERVRALGVGILDALAHAHAQGVLHRDLKPSNIFVTPSGQPKLLDFGLARLTGELTLTAPNAMAGTPMYMAPEQLRGERAGPAADLYAVGLVLYLAATGEHPFAGEEVFARSFRVPSPPSEFLPGVDPALDPVLLRALQPDPAERYPDAAAMAAALRELRPGGAPTPVDAGPTPPGPSLPPGLAWVNALVQAGHELFQPLEARMALVRRYPDEPERVLDLLGTGPELEETRNLVRTTRTFLEAIHREADASAGALPAKVVPLAAQLAAVEDALREPTARGVAAALEAGFQVCRAVATTVAKQRERHYVDLAQVARALGERTRALGLEVTAEGDALVLVPDRKAWVAHLEALLEEVLASARESGAIQVEADPEADTARIRLAIPGSEALDAGELTRKVTELGGAASSTGRGWTLVFSRGHRFLPRGLPAPAKT